MSSNHHHHSKQGGKKAGKEKNSFQFKRTKDFNNALNDMAYEQSGFLEKENDYETITQHEIIANVDMFSAQKYFDLHLEKFGPYRLNYTRNGR